MRLTPKKIEQILVTILGSDALPLIKELLGKNNISEFDLATKIKKDIKIVRRWLYTLYNHNLVGFTRKKDKLKGWYIYYWTLNSESVRFNYFKTIRERLEHYKQQMEQERKELFFTCPTKCVRLNFDHAIDFEFRCPECGLLINQDDTEAKIAEIKQQMQGLETELDQLKEQRRARRKQVKRQRKEKKRTTRGKPVHKKQETKSKKRQRK